MQNHGKNNFVRLTRRFRIDTTPELQRLCKISNDLYNQSLCHWKKRYEDDKVFLSFYDLRREVKGLMNLQGEKDFYLLKTQTSEYSVKLAHNAITSFFKAIKDWKAHPERYKAKPEFPRYHKQNGLTEIDMPCPNDCRVRDGYVIISKDCKIYIPQWDEYKERFAKTKMVRIIPSERFMTVEIVYEEERKQADVSPDMVAAIDMGIDNLCTMVSPSGCVIFNGKPLKAYNQLFNKRLAKAKSILDKQNPDGKKRSSNRIRAMYDKRDCYIETYMHTISKRIVEQLVNEKVGVLVIGKNDGWKQKVKLGSRENQKFTQIPFFRLERQLKYKCEMVGIRYVEQEESYTSKCDALAMEDIGKHEEYLGKRKKRGLFQSGTGTLINADENGALNILRKYLGDDAYKKAMKGWKLTPPKIVSVETNFKR